MIESKLLDVGDASIYYEILNAEPVIVYLHGNTTNHTVFNYLRAQFHEAGFGSIAIDQRGDGKSTHLLDEDAYTLEKHTSDLERIVEREGVKNMVIVGQSSGAFVAQSYAARHPEKTDALVLISASYDVEKSFARNPLKKLIVKSVPLVDLIFLGWNRISGVFYPGRENSYVDFSEERFRHMPDLEIALEINGNCSRDYARVMRVLSRAHNPWDTTALAPLIKAPTLIIHGSLDPLIPVETAYELSEMIPNASKPIIIPNRSHGLHFQAPEEITKHMNNFLFGEVYSEQLRQPAQN